MSDPLRPHGLQPARLLCAWGSPGKNTGAGRAENLRQRAHKIAKFVADAEALAAKLAETTVKVAAKVSETGKIYGSVTTAQLADALVAAGVEVDKKDITVAEAAKELGVYEASVKCYKDIKGTFKYEVVAE